MKKIIVVLLWIMFPASAILAQEYGIRYSYAKDKVGKDLLREVVFYDSLNKVVMKRLDVYDYNPFMKMGFKSEFSEQEQFPKLLLTARTAGDFVPQSFVSKYAKSKFNAAAVLDFGVVDLYASQTNPFYTLIFYNMKLMGKNVLAGQVGSFHFFDKRGEELLTFQQYDVNVLSADISPKGRYMVHTFGISNYEGPILKHGLRIFDRIRNQYAELSVDSAKVEKLTENYLVIISDGNAGGEVPGFKVSCFDLKRNVLYSQVYSNDYRAKFRATYGDTPVFKLDGKTLTYDKDFAGEEIKWKLYEKDWK